MGSQKELGGFVWGENTVNAAVMYEILTHSNKINFLIK